MSDERNKPSFGAKAKEVIEAVNRIKELCSHCYSRPRHDGSRLCAECFEREVRSAK